jgi:hypothetical protein
VFRPSIRPCSRAAPMSCRAPGSAGEAHTSRPTGRPGPVPARRPVLAASVGHRRAAALPPRPGGRPPPRPRPRHPADVTVEWSLVDRADRSGRRSSGMASRRDNDGGAPATAGRPVGSHPANASDPMGPRGFLRNRIPHDIEEVPWHSRAVGPGPREDTADRNRPARAPRGRAPAGAAGGRHLTPVVVRRGGRKHHVCGGAVRWSLRGPGASASARSRW